MSFQPRWSHTRPSPQPSSELRNKPRRLSSPPLRATPLCRCVWGVPPATAPKAAPLLSCVSTSSAHLRPTGFSFSAKFALLRLEVFGGGMPGRGPGRGRLSPTLGRGEVLIHLRERLLPLSAESGDKRQLQSEEALDDLPRALFWRPPSGPLLPPGSGALVARPPGRRQGPDSSSFSSCPPTPHAELTGLWTQFCPVYL